MKYPYIVVKNGKWYLAGTEVPEDAPKNEKQTTNSQKTANKPSNGSK